MKMEVLPLYCGGRYLFGFHEWRQGTSGPLSGWYEHLTKPPYTVWSREASGQAPDQYRSFMPSDYQTFCQILHKWADIQGLDIGVILAATNNSQTLAAKFLAEVGFKKGPLTQKNAWANRCQTWVGDFHQDIYPQLRKIPLPAEKKNAKFGAKS